MGSQSLSGSCACRATTYTYKSPDAPEHLDFCYCKMCQRSSGAPFMAWMGVTRADLTFEGPVKEVNLSSVATRTFCEKCGSGLTMQYECYPQKTHLAAATLTENEWGLPKVGVHIFIESCPEWYTIPDDGVERCRGFGEQFEKKFPEVIEALRRET